MSVDDDCCSPPPVGCTGLLDLPDAIVLDVLSRLRDDMVALCSAARACRTMQRLASRQSLWPGHHAEGCALVAARLALASVLHLPPQVRGHSALCLPRVTRMARARPAVTPPPPSSAALHMPAQAFAVALDSRRSRRFPIVVPLHGLRAILGAPDAEALAESVSRRLQVGAAHARGQEASSRCRRAMAALHTIRSACAAHTARSRTAQHRTQPHTTGAAAARNAQQGLRRCSPSHAATLAARDATAR